MIWVFCLINSAFLRIRSPGSIFLISITVQARFRKGRRTRDQIAKICWIIEEARKLKKKIYFCFTDYAKAFHCQSQQSEENSSRDGNTDHLICLLRNMYAGQEATVRTGHGAMDWFKIGKGMHQGCILSPCLFNLYAKYIIWNAGLDDSWTGIEIVGRNINNLIYADDTALIEESKEDLESFDEGERGDWKSWLITQPWNN